MKYWEIIALLLCIIICYYAYIKTCINIFKLDINKNSSIILLIPIIIVTFINTNYNYSSSKLVISFLLLTLVFKIVFSERYSKVLLKSLIVYLLGMIVELLIGSLSIFLQIESIIHFDDNVLLKISFSILIMLITVLLSLTKPIKKSANNIYCLFNNKKIILILMSLLFAIVIVVANNMVQKLDFLPYISQYIIIIIFLFFFYVLLKQMIDINKAIEKEKILLEFIEKYEKMVDQDRINKHEILNNLIILKSIENKNTNEYKKILDTMIKDYQSHNIFKGIYKLPPGLKGMIYYKLYEVEEIGINVIINISNKAIIKLEELNTTIFSKLCKIIGILLENAKEAAKDSIKKEIVIDIYEKNKYVELYIENTYFGKINLNKINIKNYSTKGKNRGLGLYIIQDILFGNKKIDFVQKVQEDRFISIVKIKTK